MTEVIVVTSGKGGVGKTTSSASISTGLALHGHKTVVIDFDIGLRNLDLVMGCERRVVYDFINLINHECNLTQTLIKDRHKGVDNLYVLAASQTRDKDALTKEGVGEVIQMLKDDGFEYIVCDSPAGIEKGALLALYYADRAIVTTNPEVSSVRDSDRIIGMLHSKTERAEKGLEPVTTSLLLTRYSAARSNSGEMMHVTDVDDVLGIPVIGVIPESKDILTASSTGDPVILNKDSDAGKAYDDTVRRILGEDVPLRFTEEKKGFFSKLFGR